jgi:hypothetical protein
VTGLAWSCSSAASGTVSLNHWTLGEVMPDIMPEPRTRWATVPVESRILLFIDAPRAGVVRSDQPAVTARKEVVGDLPPSVPPRRPRRAQRSSQCLALAHSV